MEYFTGKLKFFKILIFQCNIPNPNQLYLKTIDSFRSFITSSTKQSTVEDPMSQNDLNQTDENTGIR